MKCPCCKKDNERVLFRLHWSKKHYEFICGNCRTEFDLSLKNNTEKDVQNMYNKVIEFEYYDEIQEMRKRISQMSKEQLLNRLNELDRKK